MSDLSRCRQLETILANEPKYRLEQIQRALYDPAYSGWDEVSVLPKRLRENVKREVPWISSNAITILESKRNDTFKAVLEARSDKLRFETVLMVNARASWTICVSSQIGCAMACTFCATGTMGLKRSLRADEIADQYRFWRYFLTIRPALPSRISNVVFMGMGEPLANYEAVKEAIHTWLLYTDLGPTHITVSTVGILPQLEKILTDPAWPHVRIAISLHSADEKRRKEIVPTTAPEFLIRLADWSNRYAHELGSRRRYITFEYTLINKVNDTEEHALELASYMKTTAARKINVIPYNPVPGKTFERSQRLRIDQFKAVLRNREIDVTERRTMGDDIAAACGQLVYKNSL